MKRRDFIGLIGGAAAFTPFATHAQQAMPVIGLLSGTDRGDRPAAAIREGLKEFGYVEGRNVAIEHRWAEGQFERLPDLAADLVRRNVSVIVAIQSARSPLAAKEATRTIPVVFSIGGDPVRLGLVASMRQPGGNVTGASFLVNPLGAKRLELLRELMPKAIKIGLLVNPKNPSADPETRDLQAAALKFGQQIHIQHASGESEIDTAFANFAKQGIDALTFAADAVFNRHRDQLVALAARNKMPAMYFLRDFVDAGGLMSYSGSPNDAYRIAGNYAGRILKGDKPANLPVQQSTRVELVVNLKTAKALGLEIPLSLIGRADEVIE